MNYTYSKLVNPTFLKDEIAASSITVALSHIDATAASVTIVFKAALSEAQVSVLDAVVTLHVFKPDPVIASEVVVTQQPPFARPDYRTKRDGSPTWMDVNAGEVVNCDYTCPEERFVSGGECIALNAQKGDWIKAQVVDAHGYIPEPYRAAVAEAYPVIAEYVVRANLRPKTSSSDGYIYILDTYPLNARITQGLVLRVAYNASLVPGVRSFTTNYYLTRRIT
jgi:hypothetical protein